MATGRHNDYIGAIEGFKSQIRSVQRSSLFDVTIPDFRYGQANDQVEPYMLKFGVKTAAFPASTVGDLPVNYMGRVIHWYGDREYGGTWDTTCILDGEWKIFNALYAWNQGIGGANRIVSEDLNIHENFKVDAYVTAYSSDGQPAHKVMLKGLWPQNLGDIGMDWSATNAAVDLTVTWVYDYVISVDLNASETTDTGNHSIDYLEGQKAGSGSLSS